MYSDRTGTDKNHPRQNLPDKLKTSWQNLQTKTPANNWYRICTRGFCRDFCTRPSKNRGCPWCVTYFRGSREVWRGVTGGIKIDQNSLTYFMDGPKLNW